MDIPEWTMLIAVAIVIAWTIRRTNKASEEAKDTLEESIALGQHRPSSLHPIIDEDTCIGCNACVEACPEKQILGLIYGKAELISASSCVGHGACKAACPSVAIRLVLGTKHNGVTIPQLDRKYQTSVPGVFVAGELGGMGLIRNATRQGLLAVEYMLSLWEDREAEVAQSPDAQDLIIIGCGPAGISAALNAKKNGLSVTILEQDKVFGGAIASFPRKKIIMGTDVVLPLYGKIKARQLTKEELMEILTKVIKKHQLKVEYGQQVTSLERQADGTFLLHTPKQTFQSRRVLLALGRRGTPRKLGIPGEDHEKVAYSMREPEVFAGDKCAVVGGGDSALEAACMLSEQLGTTVTLIYRGDALWRAKRANIAKTNALIESGKIELLLKSNPKEITPTHIKIDRDGELIQRENTAIFVFCGGKLPIPFLESAGVEMRTVYGEEIAAT